MKVLAGSWSLLCGVVLWFSLSSSAFGSCSAPANPIEAENCLPGNTSWDVSGAGDPTIQGFATDISVNAGQTIQFKIKTDAAAYTIEIYRMGYYAGKGARLITTLQPSASLPQSQPACLSDSATSLLDCGNWAVSASWQVPSNATSGIYFARLVRTDTGGKSHVVFIVRNDTSHSAILFQASDATWQAYNNYGGPSLYGGGSEFMSAGRAFKVSYNRPFITRGNSTESATWVFGAEYPMLRWLEANGYDVTYFTGVDADRNGNLIMNHQIYLSVGHDEYWSGLQRTNVELARDAGVNLAFFSGNEVFWKTRWENSIEGSNAPYRTLVCYKETFAGKPIDPLDPPTWTGTWRDARLSPPADGGRPENSLTGTIFMVNGPGSDNRGLSIQVPAGDGKMRFWRNTGEANLATGVTAILPSGTLGYEWDEDLDNGARPAGTFDLSTATYALTTDLLLNQGTSYGAGIATHHMTLHRAASGAIVFGAGTVQWSWGLDSHHDNPFGFPTPAPDPNMQQATENLFADMGAQPATLQSGLVPATASSDNLPPTSTITLPASGSAVTSGSTIIVSGTATDAGGGVVGGVELSVDGGNTWHPTSGRESWSYAWIPNQLGSLTLEGRATDDSANTETPATGIAAVTVNPPDCPCSGWSSSTTPSTVDSGDGKAGEYGVRFRTDFDGYITGIRFYKATANTGTHIGNLWSNTGTRLATATFTNETGSGWQQVSFANPVAVTAGVTYVASYFTPSGHYSDTVGFFTTSSDVPPLHFLANGVDGANGVYTYHATSTFPTSTFSATSYWVDVVYIYASTIAPALVLNPTNLSFAALQGNGDLPSQSVTVQNAGTGTLNWTAFSNVPWLSASPSSGTTPSTISVLVDATGLATGSYTGTITISSPDVTNSPQTIAVSLTVTNGLLFSNFANGSMDGWAFSPLGLASNWSVANSVLQYNGGGPTQVFAGNSAWTDYSFNVAIKLATLKDYPGGIRGRMNPSTGAGYAVWLYPAEGVIKLYRNSAWNINTGLTLLAQGPVRFDTTSFHNVQLSFQGSQIQVFYDGMAVTSATDATNSNGLIALDVENQVISFANVLVTSANPNTGSLTPATNSLSFSASSSQTVQLNGGGGGSLAWTATSSAPWLSVSPAYGITPANLQVSVASSTLNAGNYTGSITLVSLGSVNTTQTITVNLAVVATPPILVLSPSRLNFIAVMGQSVPAQTIAVSNGGSGTFGWTVASDSSWLTVSPSSGSTPQNMSVSVNVAGLVTGSYTGNVTVTASGVGNSPQAVPVTLQVLSQDMNETFTDLATGWIISPMGLGNGWNVSNGVYSYSGLGLSQSCAGNRAWSDYALDANIQLSKLANWPGGVRARVNPSTGSGYAVWLYPGNKNAILYRVPQWNINGSGLTKLATAPLSFDTTRAHDLRMDFLGNVISVYWDGVFLMSATDSSYSNGIVCLDADNQPISYSNIQVAAVQNQVALDAITPSSLVFDAASGSTPAPQTINVSAGGANTTWAASSSVSWMTTAASSTLTPGTLTVSVNPSGLSTGTYAGMVTLSAPGASNSPIIIPVTLTVQ